MKKTLLILLAGISSSAFSQSLAIDESFVTGSGSNGIVYTVEVLPGGKIIAAGQFTEYNGNPASSIVRLNADGSYDDSFTSENLGEQFINVVAENDGKIVIGGMFGYLIRVNSDGSLDESFTPPSLFSGDFVFVSKQGDKYIVSGQFNYTNSEGQLYRNIIRLNYDGTVDASFAPIELYGTFAKNHVLSDNRIIAYGNITHYNGTEVGNIIRLNADGSLDETFNNESLEVAGNINAFALQADGKYIICGGFLYVDGVSRNMIARLTTEGDLDGDFVPPAGDTVRGMVILLQNDGKIITGGNFHDSFIDLNAPFDDSIIIYTQRYNIDGSVDAAYNIADGFNQPVFTLARQEDGKMIAGGWFTEFEGEEQNYLARFDNVVLDIKDTEEILISLYPNPVSDRLYISVEDNAFQSATVSLFNVLGRQDYSGRLSDLNTAGVDMSVYSSGMYLLKIIDGDKIFTQKIIKK